VEDLKREVDNTRTIIALQGLEELKESFSEAGLSDDQWKSFEMVFKGDVDSILTARTEAISHQIKAIIAGSGESSDMAEPPEKWPQEILSAERDKAKAQVGLDGKKQLRYDHLQLQLSAEGKLQQKSDEELANAKGADARRIALVERRRKLYVEVFQSFLDEKQVLEELYDPIQNTLKDATGALKRLRLSVSREIDLAKWINMTSVESAEKRLLDLRKESELRGHGA
jgi:hypothetical protein